MEEAIALINQLIEEHKQIVRRFQTAESIASDAGALVAMDEAKDDFVPGRFGSQKQSLQSLKESLEMVAQGLQEHFDREERGLLALFKKYGGEMMASGLRVLLLEHQELKDRIAESEKEVAELIEAKLSREVQEGKAWGVRVYMGHTRKLIEAHAQSEQELFHELRAKLKRHERQ